MKLNRLHLRNFKRFRDEEVTFRDGITGVIGNNGAGKSSLVEAVLFALYGLRGTKLDNDFIIRSTARPGDPCEVRLEFSLRGEDYTVLRTYRRTAATTQHDAQLNHGEELLATGVTDVEAAIWQVIGMGAEDFRNTIYAGQKDLLSLIDNRPGERRAWFMKVLGIDFLKKESEAFLKGEIDSDDRKLAGYEFYIRKHPEAEQDAAKQDAEGELAALREEMGALLDQEEEARAGRSAAERRYRDLQEKRDRFVGLRESLRGREERLAEVQAEGERLAAERKKLLHLEAEREGLGVDEERYAAMKDSFEELSRKRSDYERISAEIRQLRVNIGDLEDREARLCSEQSRLEEDEAACRELEPAIASRKALIEERALLREKEPQYLILVRREQEFGVEFRGYEAQAKKIRDEIGALEERLSGYPPENELECEVREQEERRESLLGRQSALEEQVRQTEEGIAEVSRHLEEVQEAGKSGDCPTCHRPLGEQYTDLLEEYRRKGERLREKAGDLQRRREEAAGEQESCGEILAGLKEQLKKVTGYTARKRELELGRSELASRASAILAAREEVEGELASLGFDPDRLAEVEKGIADLEPAWQRSLQARERLRRKAEAAEELAVVRRQKEEKEAALEELGPACRELGYDEQVYRRAREAFGECEKRHRRWRDIGAMLTRLPEVEAQEKSVASTAAMLAGERDAARGALADLAFSPEELAQAAEELERLRRSEETLRDAMREREGRVRELKTRLEEIGREAAQVREYREAAERIQNEIALLKLTRQLIGEYVTHLLSVVRSQIEGEVGRVLGQITDGRYEHVLIDEEFTVYVNDMGADFPASRFSGGEQDDIAVALRIALSHYLAGIHHLTDSTFLIFDEIFGSQDEERRGHLIQALRSQESRFPQIFLISHVPDIHGEFSNTLLVEICPDATSRVMELD